MYYSILVKFFTTVYSYREVNWVKVLLIDWLDNSWLSPFQINTAQEVHRHGEFKNLSEVIKERGACSRYSQHRPLWRKSTATYLILENAVQCIYLTVNSMETVSRYCWSYWMVVTHDWNEKTEQHKENAIFFSTTAVLVGAWRPQCNLFCGNVIHVRMCGHPHGWTMPANNTVSPKHFGCTVSLV